MATSSRHLCRAIWQGSRNAPAKRRCIVQPISRCRPPPRQFTTSMRRRAVDNSHPTTSRPSVASRRAEVEVGDGDAEPGDFRAILDLYPSDPSELLQPNKPYTVDQMDEDERAFFLTLSDEDQTKYLAVENDFRAVAEQDGEKAMRDPRVAEILAEDPREDRVKKYPTPTSVGAFGYWAVNEPDEFGQVHDQDDEVDNSMITTMAESQLQLNREVREYMRVTAWDMPLLNKFAKPFEAPTTATPLRFRYTTYMGEYHPAQKKVVVQFSTKDLAQSQSLSEAQRIKLIKLVGVRYNPSTDTVRMSCEKFENAAQNKRYLGDLVDKLVTTAKDSSDTFEDIPLDFRHYKEKKQNPQYPEEWKLTKDRVEKLENSRQERVKQLADAAAAAEEAKRLARIEAENRLPEYIHASQPGFLQGKLEIDPLER